MQYQIYRANIWIAVQLESKHIIIVLVLCLENFLTSLIRVLGENFFGFQYGVIRKGLKGAK